MVRWTGMKPRRGPLPGRMKVGEIVVRKVSPAYRRTLETRMRKAMREEGMVFSVAWHRGRFVIRRDR